MLYEGFVSITADGTSVSTFLCKLLKCSLKVLHCKNRIVKITNLLVTVTRNIGNCNLIGCVGRYSNYNPIIIIWIFLTCLIDIQRSRINFLINRFTAVVAFMYCKCGCRINATDLTHPLQTHLTYKQSTVQHCNFHRW